MFLCAKEISKKVFSLRLILINYKRLHVLLFLAWILKILDSNAETDALLAAKSINTLLTHVDAFKVFLLSIPH
jgi:hypothetical protein